MCTEKELSINQVLEMITLLRSPQNDCNTVSLFEALDYMENLTRTVEKENEK